MEQKLLFPLFSPQFCVLFCFQGELSIAAMVSSIWNMQIADSAFACWCLTFPLEVSHRLNYAPYLQSVCKHLLSSHTLPPSANPSSTHLILGASVQRQLGWDEDGWQGRGSDKRHGQMMGELEVHYSASFYYNNLFKKKLSLPRQFTSRSFPSVLVRTCIYLHPFSLLTPQRFSQLFFNCTE